MIKDLTCFLEVELEFARVHSRSFMHNAGSNLGSDDLDSLVFERDVYFAVDLFKHATFKTLYNDLGLDDHGHL